MKLTEIREIRDVSKLHPKDGFLNWEVPVSLGRGKGLPKCLAVRRKSSKGKPAYYITLPEALINDFGIERHDGFIKVAFVFGERNLVTFEPAKGVPYYKARFSNNKVSPSIGNKDLVCRIFDILQIPDKADLCYIYITFWETINGMKLYEFDKIEY